MSRPGKWQSGGDSAGLGPGPGKVGALGLYKIATKGAKKQSHNENKRLGRFGLARKEYYVNLISAVEGSAHQTGKSGGRTEKDISEIPDARRSFFHLAGGDDLGPTDRQADRPENGPARGG